MVNTAGVEYEDPYVWLEEDSEETLAWQEANNDAAARFLASLPGREEVRRVLAYHLDVESRPIPRKSGEMWFTITRPAGVDISRLEVGGSLLGQRRVLVDPSKAAPGQSLASWSPSPDGRLVAYALSDSGLSATAIRLVDTESGEQLDDSLPVALPLPVAWLPDSTGFFFSNTQPGQSSGLAIYRHRIGSPPPFRPEPLDLTLPIAVPVASADNRLIAVIGSRGKRDKRPLYVLDPSGKGMWRPFLINCPGIYEGVFVDDHFFTVSTEDAPNGRLLAIPLATPDDPTTWREIVAESEAVMATVSSAGESLVLQELVDTQPRLRVVARNGTVDALVEFPTAGCIGGGGRGLWQPGHEAIAFGEPEFVFSYSTFAATPVRYHYDVRTRQLRPVDGPDRELPGLRIRRMFATSPDGTRVPMHVIHRADLDVTRPNPTLIHGYGGFNIALLPSYVGAWLPLLTAGAVFVQAGLRGGGEYGRLWWEAGRAERKQNSFNDLYAVADHLVDTGISDPDRLALFGASNGGLLVGAAITQRPERWRAAVLQVPMLDIPAAARNGAGLLEYGDLTTKADVERVLGYSPYQNISDGRRYPATLLVCGENDLSCPPWHSRKMAARLQRSSSSGKPVLLRVLPSTGHLTASKSVEIEQAADRVAFLMMMLGLEVTVDAG